MNTRKERDRRARIRKAEEGEQGLQRMNTGRREFMIIKSGRDS